MAHRGALLLERLTRPRPDGLPNRLVLCWFPGLLLLLFAVAVITSVSGSSTGIWAHFFSDGSDPNVLRGRPWSIRSDEWLVQGSWLVSQTNQGFSSVNGVFPGGMDATVMNDVPTWDWSTAFRPHLWGSLTLGLDHGQAFRWWLQALFMLTAVYVFVVSLLPRRTFTAALVSLTLLMQPFIQWWWFPATTTPIVFAFAALTATIWALRAGSLRARLIPAVAAGYLAVTMGMSIYVPYMLACCYPAAALMIGFLLHAVRTESMPVREAVRRLVPLAASGTGAVAVMGTWVLTRKDTVDALLSTVYPGQRLVEVGTSTKADFVTLFSAPFDRALKGAHWSVLGSNQSTAATGFMVCAFLAFPLVWLLVTRWKHSGPDWPVISVLAVQVFVFAVLFVPGWDAIAHLVLADRPPPLRMRLAFVVLIPITIAVLVERLDKLKVRLPWLVGLVPAAAAVVATALVGRWLTDQGSDVVPQNTALAVGIVLGASLLLLTRRVVLVGALALCAATAVVGYGVNPLYRGTFDASRDTAAGREVVKINSSEPDAAWVGVGTWAPMAILFESAVPAYSGIQTYPAALMWEQIDPEKRYETAWNRLAHIRWLSGSGDPTPRQPVKGNSDVIELTFDACAPFAQAHVDYVLADGDPLESPCLTTLSTFDQGKVTATIYRVVKTG